MSTPLSKVLIVDDEPYIRRFVSMLLTTKFPQAIKFEADRLEVAVETYQKEKPDLVLLDINLIGEDGLATLKKLKEVDPNCKVIMLTSVNVRRAVEEAITLGAIGYLLKDTPRQELADKLENIVKRIFSNP